MNTLQTNSRLTVKIIGVGGAGGNVVQQLQSSDLAALPSLVAHTNARVLGDWSHPNKVLLGENRARGLGAGGDVEFGKQAAEDARRAITDFCKDADLVFLVTGLGGGTGGGAAPAIAKMAREAGCLVLGLATLPFDFEGVRRREQARASMKDFRAAADAVITLPNQRMTAIYDQNTPMREAFKLTNNLLAQGIRGIWQMLARPGMVNVDFAYLYSIVRGKNAESAFASAEASGEMRARDVVEKLVGSPLLDEGQVLAQSTDILVSIVGGADMTIADVNKIMEQLQRRAETANLVMGAAIDDGYEGRLCLTVVATRNTHEPVAEKPGMGAPTPRSIKPAAPAKEKEPKETKEASESEFNTNFLSAASTPRTHSRYAAPPPPTTPESASELMQRQSGGKSRKGGSKAKQQILNLEIVSKGRFEKSEPTIHRGEDLDVPTYVRRGVALN